MTNNLVEEALAWDKKENFNKPPSQKTSQHTGSSKAAFNNGGVSFNVWEKKNADRKGSGCYDFTSLMGSNKKILLRELSPKLHGVLKPETRDFAPLYRCMCTSFSLLRTKCLLQCNVTLNSNIAS